MDPEPGLTITLVSPERESPYSGMLPGHVAGLYSRAEMHIDLVRLARRANARFIRARAVGFCGAQNRITLDSGVDLAFDIASIDIGITPDLDAIAGAREHALAVKPIGDLLGKLEALIARLREATGPRRLLVVGGGAAGVCLAFALRYRLERECTTGPRPQIMLATAEGVTPEINPLARFFLRRALARAGIALHENVPVAQIDETGARLADGSRLDAEAVLVSSPCQGACGPGRGRSGTNPGRLPRHRRNASRAGAGKCLRRRRLRHHARTSASQGRRLRRQTGPGPGAQHPRTGARRGADATYSATPMADADRQRRRSRSCLTRELVQLPRSPSLDRQGQD